MSEAGSVINPYGQGLSVDHKSVDAMFPPIDIGFRPFGHRVVVQIRRVVAKTKSGIILSSGAKDEEIYNGQVAKVVAIGPLAFKKRTTGEEWPEGVWAAVGDFVKVPRWGGDRWTVDLEDGDEPVMLAILSDADLIGAYTGDVSKVRSHLT